MEEEIFGTLEKQVGIFLKKFSLNYSFKENQVEVNNKIKGSNYKSYEQSWYNNDIYQYFNISITTYLDSDSKSLIDVRICKYKKMPKNEFEKSMNVGVYYRKQKKIPIQRLEDYGGNNIEENIKNFFNWFEENIDEKLLNVLEGKDWIETPFDWGRYK